MRRPESPSIAYRPVELPREFPLLVRLAGTRDDEPVLSLHAHDVLEIGYCREGTGTFFVGRKMIPFKAGDMTVITDLEVHRCRSARGSISSWTWFFFQPAVLLGGQFAGQYTYDPSVLAGPDFANVLDGQQHAPLLAILREMIREAKGPGGGYEGSMRALIVVLLNRLHAAFGSRRRTMRLRARREDVERITPALNRISRASHEPVTMPELAATCHMCVRTFQSVFARAMGSSPQQYLIQSRVRAAQALLAGTDRPVTRIAMECGFGSLSSFNRAFRRLAGRTPREERDRSWKGP